MRFANKFSYSAIGLVCIALVIAGCAGENADQSELHQNDDVQTNSSSTSTASHDDHSGWWCVEHAIPEAECSMCSASAKEACKQKGDWCEEHNRAESQCFICDPSRAEKFAKLYEAKYGKKPPSATE